MNQHPSDNSNSHSFDDNNGSGKKIPPPTSVPLTSPTPEVEVEPEAEEARQDRIRATQQSFKRLYLILLAIGLSVGAVLAIGVAILLDRFGLSDPPSQCDRNSIGCFRNRPSET